VSGYISKIVVRRPFEGDSVVVTLRPLGFVDKLKLEEFFPDKDAVETVRRNSYRTLTFESFAVMATYIESVDGLFDQGSLPVPKEVLTRDAYFQDLAAEVFTEWFKAATPKDPQQPAAASSGDSAGSTSRPPSLRSVPAASG